MCAAGDSGDEALPLHARELQRAAQPAAGMLDPVQQAVQMSSSPVLVLKQIISLMLTSPKLSHGCGE